MAELRSFRKRKVFLALKQDLGKVYLFPEFALSTCKSFNRHLCFFVFVFVFFFFLVGCPSCLYGRGMGGPFPGYGQRGQE